MNTLSKQSSNLQVVKEDHDLSYLKKVKSKVDCWKAPEEAKKQSASSTIIHRES